MVHTRAGFGAFEFVVLSSLRVAQLVRGCTARVPSAHKHVMTAQLEVAAGLVGNCAATASEATVRARGD